MPVLDPIPLKKKKRKTWLGTANFRPGLLECIGCMIRVTEGMLVLFRI